ncbi:hypothetical protein EK904_008431, partial [Melospiza melodia maxima]
PRHWAGHRDKGRELCNSLLKNPILRSPLSFRELELCLGIQLSHCHPRRAPASCFTAPHICSATVSPMANESRPCPCDIGDKFDYGGRGQEVQVGHIKAYICKPSASTDKAVIVIHDIFGAICPDFFVGQEAWKPSNDWATFNDWVKTREASKIDKEVDVVLKYLKDQCGAKRIGVIGFCWGGAAVQHLMLKNPHLKTGVSLYGVISRFEDKQSLLHPTFFIFGEKDNIVPLDQVTLLEQKLKQNCKVDYEVKIYPGQTHGFVHRKREDINPQDKPYIEEGRKDMINWLNKYI